MPELKLLRRWGHRPAGETVEVDDITGDWLVGIGQAVRPGREDVGTATGTGRVHPGTDGPDPSTGGDPSRLRMRSEVKSPREGERAGRVQGAPRAAGDVTHVRDENLAGPNKRNRNDVPLASGKLLTEELEEHQRQLDEQDKKRSSRQGGSKDEESKTGPTASGESPQGEGRKLTQKKA